MLLIVIFIIRLFFWDIFIILEIFGKVGFIIYRKYVEFRRG